MDGVLVDNNAFEPVVANYIVSRIAKMMDVKRIQAQIMWEAELRKTSGHSRWYDYDFHCRNLGLPPLAESAHRNARAFLRTVPGSLETVEWLLKHGVVPVIATDASLWVARFKLASLGLSFPFQILTSRDGHPKQTRSYWESHAERLHRIKPIAFVDNRKSNLMAAMAGTEIRLFAHLAIDEHVMKREDVACLESRQGTDARLVSVETHSELLNVLKIRLSSA